MRFSWSYRTHLRLVLVVVCAVTLLAAAPFPAAAQSDQAAEAASQSEAAPPSDAAEQSEDCPGPFAQVDVTVDPDSELLLVDPESVKIYLPGNQDRVSLVCWKVTGLQKGQTLHIVGKEGEPDLFPNLQRRIVAPKDTANSGLPSDKGTWTYSLWITEKGSDEKLHFTDPEVIVGGGG